MPEDFPDQVDRVLRDHQGYTGDGQGGLGSLPVGDRGTARKPISNRDLRELFKAPAGYAILTAGDRAATEAARDEAVNASPFAVRDADDFLTRILLLGGARYWSKDGLAWDVLPADDPSVHFLHPVTGHGLRVVASWSFNIRAFGARAVVGFDNADAFERAIKAARMLGNSAFRYGAAVYVPAGEFEVSRAVWIDVAGTALIGEGSVTSVIKAQAGFAAVAGHEAVVIHSPDGTSGTMVGAQLRGIGIICNHVSGLRGYLGEIVYDNVVYDDVRVSHIAGNATGFHLRPKPGHSLEISQTVDLRSVFVAKYTQKGTVPAVILEKCQEINIWSSKAWNGPGQGADRGDAATWYIRDCRSLTMVGCSYTSSLHSGLHIVAQDRTVDTVNIIAPTFENLGDIVVTEAPGAFRILNLRIFNPRTVNPIGGRYNLDGLTRGMVEVDARAVTLGLKTTTTTVLADQLSQVTDGGTRNQVQSRVNAVDAWQGFGHHIRVQVSEGVMFATAPPASGESGILLAHNNGSTVALKKVVLGAPDSAGTGFRQLRISN